MVAMMDRTRRFSRAGTGIADQLILHGRKSLRKRDPRIETPPGERIAGCHTRDLSDILDGSFSLRLDELLTGAVDGQKEAEDAQEVAEVEPSVEAGFRRLVRPP
jgi:hypothetical protein